MIKKEKKNNMKVVNVGFELHKAVSIFETFKDRQLQFSQNNICYIDMQHKRLVVAGT